MATPRLFAAALLSGIAGLASSSGAQQSGKAHHRCHNLTFVKQKEFSRPGLDSLIVLEATENGARIVATYDNPCGVKPAGQYRVSSDTLFVLLHHNPALSANVACPGVYIPEAFAADIKPLRPGRYLVRVAFKGRLWPQQPMWREIEVK